MSKKYYNSKRGKHQQRKKERYKTKGSKIMTLIEVTISLDTEIEEVTRLGVFKREKPRPILVKGN